MATLHHVHLEAVVMAIVVVDREVVRRMYALHQMIYRVESLLREVQVVVDTEVVVVLVEA